MSESNDRFKENLDLIVKGNSKLAELIENTDLSGMELICSKSGEPNLRCQAEGKSVTLHSNYSPIKEAEKWVSKLDIETYEILYVYGIGLGFSFIALKEWLEEKVERYLIFLEDDLRVLYYLLHQPWAREMIENRQVMINFVGTEKEDLELEISRLTDYFLGVNFQCTALSYYDVYKGERYDELRLGLRHKAAHANYSAMEFLCYGGGYYRNFYQTILHLQDSYWGYSLLKCFQGIPAIICGAGPSLDNNVEVLRQYQDRAIVLAGGSAVNALATRGVEVNFGASVDPNNEQYVRMVAQSAYETPMFYKSRVNKHAFKTLHGPCIYLPGSPAYPLTQLVEQKLGINASMLKEGMNVLHLLIELSCFLGCDPIIFVGMDLAYSGNKLYAEGIIDDNEVSDKELTRGTHLNNNCFLREDIYGKPVHTLWKWVAESKYSATFPERYPNITFINATEGGLGMGKVPNEPLKDVAKRHLTQQFDIRGYIHNELQKGRFKGIHQEKTIEVLTELYDDLEEVLELSKQQQKVIASFREAVQEESYFEIEKNSLHLERLKNRISEKISFQYIIYPLLSVKIHGSLRKMDQIEDDQSLDSNTERLDKMLDTNLEQVVFQIEAAQVNLNMMRQAMADHGSCGYGSVAAFFENIVDVCDEDNAEEVLERLNGGEVKV